MPIIMIRFARRTIAAIVGAAWYVFSLQPAGAANLSEYRLSTGDVLEITAVGAAELQRKAPIELNGDVVLPLIGPVKAAGMTIASFQTKLREALRSQVFRRRTPDGREYP